ncbi:MAG: AmmeMemoRadiSam system protein B [Verrucomicrobiota bacterium]
MKQPIEASLGGTSYPADPEELLGFLREAFDLPGAPPWPVEADQPTDKQPADPGLLGVIAPHIDLRVSRVAYAHAFAPLLRVAPVPHYLILGVGHRCRQEWAVDGRSWHTALGTIAADPTLAEFLGRELGPELLADPGAFHREHSIEFPLVWLQAIHRLRGLEPDFRIAPVLCGGLYGLLLGENEEAEWERLRQLGSALAQWCERCQKEGGVRVIVSIDGCHEGSRFDHDYPVTPARQKQTRAWEDFFWRYVERHDADGLIGFLRQDMNARYFDGVGACLLLLEMLGRNFRLERSHYEQWVEPRDRSMVTFTSAALTR